MNRSTEKRNNYIRGYELPNAAKVPPQIAPGILCPKCGSAMLDERQNKRTDKSPDYSCSNMLCVQIKNGKTYRTSIWADKPVAQLGALQKPVAVQPPPFLANQEAEDAAELKSKIGDDPAERDKTLLAQRSVYAIRMKQSVKFVLDEIEPLYKAKGIGMSDDGAYKHAFSIWSEWCHRGIIS